MTAWKLWCDPPEFEQPLKRRQARRCTLTERRLLKTAEDRSRITREVTDRLIGRVA